MNVSPDPRDPGARNTPNHETESDVRRRPGATREEHGRLDRVADDVKRSVEQIASRVRNLLEPNKTAGPDA